MTGQAYQTMSKFCRINLERPGSADKSKKVNVDQILSNIKHLNDRPLKMYTNISVPGVSERLLACPSNSLNLTKTRSRYISRQKQVKKAPTIRKYEKQQNELQEVPSSVQYSPNYEASFPSAPSFPFPRACHERMIDSRLKTQSEMIKVWEKGPRTVKFGPKNKPKKEEKKVEEEEEEEEESNDQLQESNEKTKQNQISSTKPIIPPPKIINSTTKNLSNLQKKQPVGLISQSCDRNSFIPKNDIPAPGHYQVKRLLVDRNCATSFDGQSTRKSFEPKADRTYFNLGKNIDSTKPQPPRCLPFKIQLSRSKEVKQKDIWSEIEKEQQQLYDVLHPKEIIEIKEKSKVQPFSRQTTYFDKHPFHSFMGPEDTKDLVYDVDLSFKLADKKIKPANNFGRRITDNDRAIYVTSEAPDVFYKNVNEEWLKTKKNYGGAPIFNNMHERKSIYDYMSKDSSGGYIVIKDDNWNSRTPALMDKMGEREMMLNLPPQYA